MKVNDLTALGNTQSATRPAQPHRARAGSAAPNDEIQLSGLSQALAALQTNSPQRDARLGQLSAQVGGGSYIVDHYAVSGSLIRETLAASAA